MRAHPTRLVNVACCPLGSKAATGYGNRLHDLAVICLGQGQTALMAASIWGVLITFDGGTTWYLMSERHLNQIIVPPDFAWSEQMFAIDTQGDLHRTDNLDQDWKQVYSHGVVQRAMLSPDYPLNHTLYVQTYTVLAVSYDAGETWADQSTRPDGFEPGGTAAAEEPLVPAEPTFEVVPQQLVVSPNFDADGMVFSSQFARQYDPSYLVTSDDGGRHWRGVPLPLASDWTSLAVSPAFVNDRTVLASVANRLLKSVDAGER